MTIQFGSHFLTGIKRIDHQHERLVALVNRLREAGCRDPLPQPRQMDEALMALVDYAAEHFALEEQMMASAGVNSEHLKAHKSDHLAFVAEITGLWRGRDLGTKGAATDVLEFLDAWIYRDMLISDHIMASDYYLTKGMTPPLSLLLSPAWSRRSEG